LISKYVNLFELFSTYKCRKIDENNDFIRRSTGIQKLRREFFFKSIASILFKRSDLNFSLLSDRSNVGHYISAHCNRNKLCPQTVTLWTFSLCFCLYILNSRIFSRKTRPVRQIFIMWLLTFYPRHTVGFIRILARNMRSVKSMTCKQWRFCLIVFFILSTFSLFSAGT
jgi:hypothetical protein